MPKQDAWWITKCAQEVSECQRGIKYLEGLGSWTGGLKLIREDTRETTTVIDGMYPEMSRVIVAQLKVELVEAQKRLERAMREYLGIDPTGE